MKDKWFLSWFGRSSLASWFLLFGRALFAACTHGSHFWSQLSASAVSCSARTTVIPFFINCDFPQNCYFLKGHNLYSFLNLFPQTILLTFCLFQGSLKWLFLWKIKKKTNTLGSDFPSRLWIPLPVSHMGVCFACHRFRGSGMNKATFFFFSFILCSLLLMQLFLQKWLLSLHLTRKGFWYCQSGGIGVVNISFE